MGMAGGEEFSGGESQGAANGQKEKILVSIRMRPLNEKERVRNDISDWECINKNTVIFRGNISDRGLFPSAYTFDRVFGSETSTKQVYEETAKEVSLSVLRGINSSVFAYGQTSSGKTYTMSGITLYAVADIFNYIEKHREREYILKFSAIEIYNEAVRDLLSFDSTPLRLLDDPEKGTVIERLAEETLRDWNHFQELLSICEAQRQIGETSMNEMSSRSHQILRLTIESSAREFLGAENSSTLAASVNFVDLAGSERASQTSSAGARLKEGSHINRSLLTLGTVIRKLSKGRSAHIPYRDSKLTRILHNALGGNARTAIICTISPARSHVEQSRNTLLFANCAKEVSTNAQVNVLMSDKALVKQLQRELARMENELRNLGSAPATSDPTELLEEKEHLITKMEAEIQELIRQRDLAHSRVQDLLRSSAEDNFSKQDTCSEPESEDKIGPLHCRVPQEKFNEDKTFERLSSNMSYLQLPDTPEDNFLLDGSSPRLSLSTPYSRRLEETFPRIDEDAEDTCKEVRCIEVEEPCVETKEGPNNHLIVPDETETKADTASTVKQDVITHFEKSERDASNVNIDISIDDINKKIQDMQKTINCLVSLYPQQKSERDASDINANISYDNLNKKIQDIQKTINCLVSLYPQGQSPDSSEVDATSCKSFTTRRSRSCRTLVMAVPPFQWPEKIEQSENPTPDEFEKESSANSVSFHKRFASSSSSEEFTRRDSLIPASTDVSDSEGVASTQSISLSKLSKVQPNTSDDPDTANHNNQPTAESRAPNTYINHGSVTKSQTTDQVWASEFEKKRREIIELWDMCKVPLVHRTYFFLLFQGDPSDSVYMEVELRRLSFLKGTVFTGTKAFTDVLASSSKALTREREMLSRRMHKKLMRKERESLYQKWGIGLSTKQRSIQLAHRLWSDTKDFSHVAMSAELVAKLFGLVETSRAPREMFELSFSPARQMGMSWRSFSSWNH